ncbi:MAG: DNA/RNA helicase domain-containing protein [Gemmatimonadales bacterium]
MRLKPHAIDVRVNVDPIHWFLNERKHRSSWYLEDAATEFQVQGLELDWAIVTWDADLRHTPGGWRHHQFRGKKWEQSHKEERQRYCQCVPGLVLTRARQGMVIFVRPGDAANTNRKPEY